MKISALSEPQVVPEDEGEGGMPGSAKARAVGEAWNSCAQKDAHVVSYHFFLAPTGCAAAALAAISFAAAVTSFFGDSKTRFGDFDELREAALTGTGLLFLWIGTVAAGSGGRFVVILGVGAFLVATGAGDLARAGDFDAGAFLLAATLRFVSRIFFLVASLAFFPTDRDFCAFLVLESPFAIVLLLRRVPVTWKCVPTYPVFSNFQLPTHNGYNGQRLAKQKDCVYACMCELKVCISVY